MRFDAAAIAECAARPLPSGPWPEGAPPRELLRSRAAARVGVCAAAAGVPLFHYEHRVLLDPPDEWLPAGVDSGPTWAEGVLPEPKYGAFRHDLRIGSFHPGHRAKWTAHELCHALVGFGWRPGAPPLFLATAARLAELAPVVLWYFLDEIGLRRCPRHTGPLFRTFCADCEQAAAEGAARAPDPRAEQLAADAIRFLEAELAAVARTRRLGRPVPHVHGSLDLCSDGLAYVAAHGRRLGSEAFAAWAERFLLPGDPGVHQTLDDIEARVIAVIRAIGEDAALAPATTRPALAAQDLGQRLLEIRAQADEPCAGDLLRIVDGLAGGASVAETHAAYADLHETYDLPDPADVFAVGYALDGVQSRSISQIESGLRTVVPIVLAAAEDAGLDLVPAFVAADAARPERRPLGLRFADWLAGQHPGPAAELAAYEASLRSASGEPEAAVLGAEGTGWRLASGVQVRRFGVDVVALAEEVDSGEIGGCLIDGRLMLEGVEPASIALAIGRDEHGGLVIAEIEPELCDRLGDPSTLPPDVLEQLVSLGLVVPAQWQAE